jgi:hypothetical protein
MKLCFPVAPKPGVSLPKSPFPFWDGNRFRLGRWLIIGLVILLTGCATHTLGPRPSTAAVTVSNAATRASVKASRTAIKASQVKAAAGADALTNVASDLDQLLKK